MIQYITDKGEVLTSNDYDLIEIDKAPFYKVVNKNGRALKQFLNKCGYVVVQPCFNGKQKFCSFHRLVMSTLRLNEYFDGAQVNHIDEDKTNNKLSNLEWLSHKDNINHGTHNERMAESLIGVFINRKDKSKPVIQLTKSGFKVAEYPSTKEAERQTGINCGSISSCCCGKRKFAGDCVWRYKEQ